MTPGTGAILLAGGRGSRVDGAAKPLFTVAGRTLLQRAVDAVAGCDPITVVGPREPAIGGVSWTREHPPFGGPAAGVLAALTAWDHDPEWTYLLGCDLPAATAAVARLESARPLLPGETDGVCLAADARPQWLIGVYRTTVLRRGAAALPGAGRDASLRALLSEASIAVIDAPETETADVDTWQDLAAARGRMEQYR